MGMFLVKFNINFNLSINNHENFKYDSFKRYRTPTFKRQLWRESHGDMTVLSERFCYNLLVSSRDYLLGRYCYAK